MADADDINPKGDETTSLEFNYIKSKHFRVIYADSSWGGMVQSNMLHFALYNERYPIPQVTELQKGETVETIKDAKEGIVREVEVDVVMNLESAKNLANWILDFAKYWEESQMDRPDPNTAKRQEEAKIEPT